MTAAQAGFVLSLGNVGTLAGALLARRAAAPVGGIGRALVASAALGGLGWLLVPLASPGVAVPALAAALGIFGFAAAVGLGSRGQPAAT